ncbi:glutathione S-transferase family protein [Salinarimonas rosea]|uniref:glutathione S-transferase family protein n=1 Tax=Salinarimonas rosea TaxID=552063 RepID=UPI0004031D31|nr:glutathione S-transferase family protein [Salinarimonas rosea]
MKLYGIPPTRATRPIWLLNELGLDCEIVTVDIPQGEHLGAAFLAVNPFGKVPALVDGNVRIAESAAISLYLAERYGDGRFIPGDSRARAEMYQWIFLLVTEIEQPLWREALHTAIYAEHERRPEEVALAHRDCRRMLEPLNAHMTGRDFFVGSTPTVADFIGASTLDWAREAGLLEASPALTAFVDRMYAREAAPPTIAEGFATLHAGGIPDRYRRPR